MQPAGRPAASVGEGKARSASAAALRQRRGAAGPRIGTDLEGGIEPRADQASPLGEPRGDATSDEPRIGTGREDGGTGVRARPLDEPRGRARSAGQKGGSISAAARASSSARLACQSTRAASNHSPADSPIKPGASESWKRRRSVETQTRSASSVETSGNGRATGRAMDAALGRAAEKRSGCINPLRTARSAVEAAKPRGSERPEQGRGQPGCNLRADTPLAGLMERPPSGQLSVAGGCPTSTEGPRERYKEERGAP